MRVERDGFESEYRDGKWSGNSATFDALLTELAYEVRDTRYLPNDAALVEIIATMIGATASDMPPPPEYEPGLVY